MTPDELAKSGTEHGHQRAFFAWCAKAEQYGFIIADNPLAYSSKTWADEMAEIHKDNPGAAPVPHLSLIHAIHNQGHGDKIRGNRARAEGVKAGIPDIFWPYPRREFRDGFKVWPSYAGLYIELKRPSAQKKPGGKTSEKQDETIDLLNQLGYCVVVAYGWREAADTVKQYVTGQI